MQPQSILNFCFEELTAKQHFVKDAALDETVRAQFGDTLEAAARCELFVRRATAEGRLAEISMLDDLSRSRGRAGWHGVYFEASVRPLLSWPQDLALH